MTDYRQAANDLMTLRMNERYYFRNVLKLDERTHDAQTPMLRMCSAQRKDRLATYINDVRNDPLLPADVREDMDQVLRRVSPFGLLWFVRDQ